MGVGITRDRLDQLNRERRAAINASIRRQRERLQRYGERKRAVVSAASFAILLLCAALFAWYIARF
ncbi:MAG: hypothetical protein LBS72_04175 [Oscillospiraceae bacterium]|jgi:hypothetical protein|nr:hypothetical protein [Oscillospiraceae bacterium]